MNIPVMYLPEGLNDPKTRENRSLHRHVSSANPHLLRASWSDQTVMNENVHATSRPITPPLPAARLTSQNTSLHITAPFRFSRPIRREGVYCASTLNRPNYEVDRNGTDGALRIPCRSKSLNARVERPQDPRRKTVPAWGGDGLEAVMAFGWFNARTNPIAVDIGTDLIKVLQVEPREGALRLQAAACMEIPDELRTKPNERDAFTAETLRKLLADGSFRGKQVVTCLPASSMAVQHLRLPKMSPEDIQKALPFEAAGKLPFDPARAVLRHVIAGEVYQNSETRIEVILMAAPRDRVERHLATISKAKAEVVGIHVEPTALIGCFAHLFRRKGDDQISTMFIDMGAGSTHVVIAHGTHLVFAKHVCVGGDLFTQSVAESLKVNISMGRSLRLEAAARATAAHRLPPGVVAISAGPDNAHPLGMANTPRPAAGKPDMTEEIMQKIAAALADPVETLVCELQMCVRYYESIFPDKSVDRIIFVGGESRQVPLCQLIAQRLGLPATLGDPLARLAKDEKTACSIDFRQPQPAWAIAVGLGVGQLNNDEKSDKPGSSINDANAPDGAKAKR
jgi:type IV pilus assembly protein PilM